LTLTPIIPPYDLPAQDYKPALSFFGEDAELD